SMATNGCASRLPAPRRTWPRRWTGSRRGCAGGNLRWPLPRRLVTSGMRSRDEGRTAVIAERVKAWDALEAHRSTLMSVPLRKRFADDPERFRRFSLSFRDLLLDYSKNLVDAETMTRLFALARVADVEGKRAQMFAGEA